MPIKIQKIVFLSKRRPQNRDLFTNPYGRFYHIPKLLSEKGIECHLILADYRGNSNEKISDGDLYTHSVGCFPNPFRFLKYVKKLLKQEGILEDILIIGFSDIYFGILAVHLAKRYGIQSLIDAYDNYEAYIPWAKPLHWVWRNSLKQADYLTAAGPQLLKLMSKGKVKARSVVLPMAADPNFIPLEQASSRIELDLPQNKYLIGYLGSLHKNRGIEPMIEAIEQIELERQDIRFIMSGFKKESLKLPDNVLHLGYIPSEKVPVLLNSLDLCISINMHTAFGNYSYPSKIYEALSCHIRIIASNTPSSSWILSKHPGLILKDNAPETIKNKIYEILDSKEKVHFETTQWMDTVNIFKKEILDITQD